MMLGRGKSDSAMVAVKPTNNAEQSATEPVARSAEAKGMRIGDTRAGRRTGKACHKCWTVDGR
jgi:hypothetical protein